MANRSIAFKYAPVHSPFGAVMNTPVEYICLSHLSLSSLLPFCDGETTFTPKAETSEEVNNDRSHQEKPPALARDKPPRPELSSALNQGLALILSKPVPSYVMYGHLCHMNNFGLKHYPYFVDLIKSGNWPNKRNDRPLAREVFPDGLTYEALRHLVNLAQGGIDAHAPGVQYNRAVRDIRGVDAQRLAHNCASGCFNYSLVMNSPDSYGDLELDPAVFNELAVIEATILSTSSTSTPTQTATTPGQRLPSKKEVPLTDPDLDSDSNGMFDPTFDNLDIQDLVKMDAAIADDYLKASQSHPSESRLNDDKSPTLSLSRETKQKANKRKFDEEGGGGERRSKRLALKRQRGRGQARLTGTSTRSTRHSRKPPPDGVRKINAVTDKDTCGGTDSDSKDGQEGAKGLEEPQPGSELKSKRESKIKRREYGDFPDHRNKLIITSTSLVSSLRSSSTPLCLGWGDTVIGRGRTPSARAYEVTHMLGNGVVECSLGTATGHKSWVRCYPPPESTVSGRWEVKFLPCPGERSLTGGPGANIAEVVQGKGAGEGPVKPVAGLERIGPSTARKGNPHVASVVCLVPAGDPNPPAAGGAVHTSRQAYLLSCWNVPHCAMRNSDLVAGLVKPAWSRVIFTPVVSLLGVALAPVGADMGSTSGHFSRATLTHRLRFRGGEPCWGALGTGNREHSPSLTGVNLGFVTTVRCQEDRARGKRGRAGQGL
ncbi:hypothetical protein H4582DRAFT_2059327 [Lactarius indigo]|nr:hypothetical protein H4582DRAFT_2059327 [Lactarius indigo]